MLNPAGKLEALLEKVYEEQKLSQALFQGQKIYDIKKFRIQQLSIKKVLEMHYNISIRFYSQLFVVFINKTSHKKCLPGVKINLNYLFGSLLYTPIITKKQYKNWYFYPYLQGDADWSLFASIFSNKDKIILQYEGKCIVKKKVKSKKWDRQEVKLFYQISQKHEFLNKWNKIARDLFLFSNKIYFRTGKQCRQYWNNHLNPTISHSSWTLYEDFHLLLSVIKEGKKWARIAKLLGGKRTEHMIKNRYKSLYNFQRKNSSFEQEDEWIIIEQLKIKLEEKVNEEKDREEVNIWKEEEDRVYEAFF